MYKSLLYFDFLRVGYDHFNSFDSSYQLLSRKEALIPLITFNV